MIGFFTDLYPDELLYSACARYTQRTGFQNRQTVITQLFGKKGYSAAFDFPNKLDHLISVLPKGHNYTTTGLIDNHSLLPYFERFVPLARGKLIRSEMAGDGENKISMRVGAKSPQLRPLSCMRYCPDCVVTDRQRYGETFWHRLHQLPGILTCSAHNCLLEDSDVKLGRMSASYFMSAEEFLPSKLPDGVRLNPSDRDNQIFMKLAFDAEWLLAHRNMPIGSEAIQKRYFNILLRQGFAYYNGRIRHNKLLAKSKEMFSSTLFSLVGAITKKENWVIKLAEPGEAHKVLHPVRHLLFFTLLEMSAKEFFEDFTEYKPFGEGPYPCLNKAAKHHRKLVIKAPKIMDNLTKAKDKQGLPFGVFQCKCEFIYQRLGPDQNEEDKFRYDSVRDYGDSWEKKFASLWADLKISTAEIGRQLGVSQTTVSRLAIRFNLPMNTSGTRSLKGYDRHRNPRKLFYELRAGYRDQWLQIRKDHPELNKKLLFEKENHLILWLTRHDSEWFEENRPDREKIRNPLSHVNWEEEDIKLSNLVSKICDEILSARNPMKRISLTEIIRRIGYQGWFDKRKEKLPMTTEILERRLETFQNFMLRKVDLFTEMYIEERVIPTELQFRIRAVMRNSTAVNSEEITLSVKNALAKIKDSFVANTTE